MRPHAVAAVLLVVVLYAVAGATWFMHSERAWSKARKQYEKEFEKLKFRRDWRTVKGLSLDEEAVRRVALAKEEEAAAQLAVKETAENTRRAADALEAIENALEEN